MILVKFKMLVYDKSLADAGVKILDEHYEESYILINPDCIEYIRPYHADADDIGAESKESMIGFKSGEVISVMGTVYQTSRKLGYTIES